ncbi:coiled-coil domain-containing protein 63-like, partial [Mytilus edulis]
HYKYPPQWDVEQESGDELSDEVSQASELSKLQRQLRVMENDRRSYAEEAQNYLRKQQSEIANLSKENLDMRTVLKLAQSDKNENKDLDDTEKLFNLIESLDYYNNSIKLEKMRVNELDNEILKAERKIANQRKQNGSNTEIITEKNILKKIHVMENRLNKATVKFNNQLAVNGHLRKEIDHLRQERSVFDNLYKKISKELNETTKKMNDVISKASVAYEERDEAQTKMIALKERSEKDIAQHESEMKDLQRVIHHDNKLKEFFNAKSNDRALYKEEEEAKKSKNSKDKDTDAENVQIQTFEEAIDKIKEATGETDIETIVDNFIKKEDENFALYNYVNELNDEVEHLQREIDEMNREIKRIEADGIKQEDERIKVLQELEIRGDKITKETEQGNKKLVEINKTLDQLKSGVLHLFGAIDCDPSSIKDMLGSEKGVTNKNIMKYMGIIEGKTMDYLQKHEYNEMKKNPPPPEKKDKKGEPSTPSTQMTKVTEPPPISINPPSAADDEELEIPEEQTELRPLTHEELKLIAQRNIGKRVNTLAVPSPTKAAKSPRAT